MGLYIGIAVVLIILALVVIAIVSPRRFVRGLFRPALALFYRKRIIGLENLPKEGGCLVISNHISWIDGIVILWMLPRNVRFLVDASNFESRLGSYLGRAFDTIFMYARPKSIGKALRTAREGLNEGDVIGVFPEGSLSRNGQLQGFRAGMQKILKGTEAPIIPMHLEGLWGSIFSFSGGNFFLKWPRKFRRTLTLHIGKPLPNDIPLDAIRGSVSQLHAESAIEQRGEYDNLPLAVIKSWRKSGSRVRVADSSGTELTGRSALMRTLILRRALRRECLDHDETNVGVFLPPSAAGVLTNVAMALDKRVTANLNYTVSSPVINHCIKEMNIRHVISSKRFMEKIDLEIDAEVIELESLKDKITLTDKLIGFMMAMLLPMGILSAILGLGKIQPDDLLTVIFTSGSTGMPKGVQLTHANISHNVEAINRAVTLRDDDVILGILPFFHSFGYTVTLWTAQALGTKSIYHFNPLDARQIGKLSEKYGVTVILGTPTFVRGYIRRIEPKQFDKLDICIVGAEKMPADLFDAFEKRFGVRPVEGYGTTELSPLVSVNIPISRSTAIHHDDRREGSVGQPLPGVSAKIVDPDTGQNMPCGEDGMLLIKGPNVMAGYANNPEKTAQVLHDGWYTTGDIAHLDLDGFIYITGRVSRFSKIGGEMVPHVTVEELIVNSIGTEEGGSDEDQPAISVAVTAVPDSKKGERLIVLHQQIDKTVDEIITDLKDAGLPNLFIPGRDAFYQVDTIPLLGTGKLDLKGAKDLALEITDTGASLQT